MGGLCDLKARIDVDGVCTYICKREKIIESGRSTTKLFKSSWVTTLKVYAYSTFHMAITI